MDLNTFENGNIYSKLDFEPRDSYDREVEALEDLVDGYYDGLVDAAKAMSPRTSHEAFRSNYVNDSPFVSEDHIYDMIDVIEENSESSRGQLGDKVFEIGYCWREPFIDLRRVVETPYMNHESDDTPDTGVLFSNPFTEGLEKRQSDKYYSMAVGQMFEDMRDFDIEIR